jgi:prolyl oligopeptidase
MKQIPTDLVPALLLVCALAAVLGPRGASAEDRLAYPATRTVDATDVLHGVTVSDPYRWLEDASSPEVKKWMAAQDDLARKELAKLPAREKLLARLKELAYLDSVSAPVRRGNRYFLVRRHATKEKSVVYWKDGKGGEEKVLFDPNGWSKDGSISLGGWQPTWDGSKVAYQVRANNSDEATLRVVDVASGKVSEVDVVEGAKYATASWTPDGSGFYYTWLPTDPKIPASERPGFQEVRFHRLGEDPKMDRVVRERLGDPTAFLAADVSRDGRWLVLSVQHGWTSTDVSFRDLTDPKQADRWTPLVVGTQAHWNVEVFRERFFVTTDDGAPRGRVYGVDPLHPARKEWKEIVPQRSDATLANASVLGGRLALNYLKDASSLLEVRELDGSLVREVKLPGLGTVGGPSGLPDDDEAYFSFESYTTPREIYATSMKSGKLDLFAKLKVPVDPSPYVVEQVTFPSKDGTKVSMFLVHRKDLKRDGKSRCILYGYGGFQVNETPYFSALLYPWLEAGGVWATVNLRGGGEYGEDWHRNGMLLKKQNTFDDFLAASRWLSAKKVTGPDRLAIYGGSNGGLLVGAAMTQDPKPFSAVLCAVPLLDMVRYHLFGSGRTWISEYGSAEDPKQFEALRAYSPYHAVKKGTAYPATLLLSADSDDRVDPMHARKFAGALQAATTGGPVLLRIERNSGHGGADMVKASVESRADEFAFVLAHTKGN